VHGAEWTTATQIREICENVNIRGGLVVWLGGNDASELFALHQAGPYCIQALTRESSVLQALRSRLSVQGDIWNGHSRPVEW